ncbi:hypothetical protein Calkro_0368 [Caldicellulosiruptor kronotskyensis 2002]|uniref:Uncharacterized protein n=1 Tax=Caldicellulosiruptor kronotskyensis (strain DSM 18902 / VKM B-2412 / 2002) TaxID=632348 RepID=E4SDY4_CALK2|nr:hypothetical protein Calkro_0368 [Caldicellulosiruptor kronotskyensis 2002]
MVGNSKQDIKLLIYILILTLLIQFGLNSFVVSIYLFFGILNSKLMIASY